MSEITYVVLVPVVSPLDESLDGRKLAESIENNVFDSLDAIQDDLLYDEAIILNLSDFMDYCNNRELILDNYWVSYVRVENKVNK